jgi:hypothetical protein
VSLTSSRVVGTFLVERFRLTSPWRLSPQEVAARAGLLLGPPSATPAVLIQRGPES